MRILHIGMMIGGGFSKALKDNSTHLKEIHSGNAAEVLAVSGEYDLVFMQVQNHKMGDKMSADVLTPLCKRYPFSINWNGDIRNSLPSWMLTVPSTVVAFSNMRDVDRARSNKRRSEFLQIGIDPEIFTPQGEQKPGADIVYFANDYGNLFPLSSFRRDVVKVLKQRYGERFAVYGNFPGSNGNYNVQGEDVNFWQHQEAAIYRNAKIAISISHYQERRYTSDRLLRALACGPLVMCHRYPEMEADFREGEHLIGFERISELCDKIDHHLGADNSQIQQAGAQLISEKYTFDSMVKNIIKIKG